MRNRSQADLALSESNKLIKYINRQKLENQYYSMAVNSVGDLHKTTEAPNIVAQVDETTEEYSRRRLDVYKDYYKDIQSQADKYEDLSNKLKTIHTGVLSGVTGKEEGGPQISVEDLEVRLNNLAKEQGLSTAYSDAYNSIDMSKTFKKLYPAKRLCLLVLM